MNTSKYRVWDALNKAFCYCGELTFLARNSNKHFDGLTMLSGSLSSETEAGRNYFNNNLAKEIRSKHQSSCIQQSIGIKDKNNVMVYDGDLINFTVKTGSRLERVEKAEVWFDPKLLKWSFGQFKNHNWFKYSYDMSDEINADSIEVVGNVFEK
jgi:hypothetical protein